MQATAPTAADEEQDQAPPDIETMRATAGRALAEETSTGTVDTLIPTLRGMVQLLIPDVEQLASRQPKDDIPRACALACCGEARMRLRLGDGETPAVRAAMAQRLARSVNALCDHYENLGGVTA